MFTTKVSMGCLRQAFGIATKNSYEDYFKSGYLDGIR